MGMGGRGFRVRDMLRIRSNCSQMWFDRKGEALVIDMKIESKNMVRSLEVSSYKINVKKKSY